MVFGLIVDYIKSWQCPLCQGKIVEVVDNYYDSGVYKYTIRKYECLRCNWKQQIGGGEHEKKDDCGVADKGSGTD